jgi:segregation and condensation protein B
MELKFVLEAILFSAQEPLDAKELKNLLTTAAEQGEPGARDFKKISAEQITAALDHLAQEHAQAQRSYRLACVAGAWQFFSEPEYAPWIKALVGHRNRPTRLSQPALETLAIIAYRQPLTRAEVEQIRGVAVDAVLQTLLDRGLVHQAGRAEVPGRPMTFGTTPLFLEYFGLRSLGDLPAADELRRVVIQKPETLLTVDPGLATAPPEELSVVETPQSADPALGSEPSAQPLETSGSAEPAAWPIPTPHDEHSGASQGD